MFGWIDQGHKRAARTARETFSAAYPGERVAWTDIVEEDPARFIVGVHYGQGSPKKCRTYSVDRKSFQVTEIKLRS